MHTGSKSKRIQKYLELMAVLPPVSPEAIQVTTLERLRSAAPVKLSQVALAKAVGRSREQIIRWESGLNLDGINSRDILTMVELFNRRPEEILLAIENTRLLTEEEENN
jgi:ABC-type ATPase involved in cell division